MIIISQEKKIKQKWLPYLVFIFCFEPKLFVKYPLMNYLYIAGSVFSFFAMCYLYVINNKKLSKMFWAVIFYRISFMVQTFLAEGDILTWGYFSIVLLTIFMAIEFYAKINIKQLLDIIINVLTLLLTVNLFIVLLVPKGIIDGIYFIGIRTRFTDVIFPLLILTLILDRLKEKKITAKSIYIFVVSVFTIIRLWIATAVIGIILLALFILIYNKCFRFRIVNIFTIAIMGLVLNYWVVFGNLIEAFEWLITGVLDKSMNFSGRTEIWEIASQKIRSNVLFGYGMYENGGFVWWGYKGGEKSYWQAHNQWLQIMHDGGLLVTISFLTLIFMDSKRVKRIKDKRIGSLLLAVFSAFFIMMIMEIYSYTPYIYLLIFIAYNSSYFNVNKEVDA